MRHLILENSLIWRETSFHCNVSFNETQIVPLVEHESWQIVSPQVPFPSDRLFISRRKEEHWKQPESFQPENLVSAKLKIQSPPSAAMHSRWKPQCPETVPCQELIKKSHKIVPTSRKFHILKLCFMHKIILKHCIKLPLVCVCKVYMK